MSAYLWPQGIRWNDEPVELMFNISGVITGGHRMNAIDKLIELEDRHDELLEQLSQLDQKITETLKGWAGEMTDATVALEENGRVQPISLRIKSA